MHFPRLFDFADEALKMITFSDAPPVNESISSRLWQACQDIAQQALNSTFMQGIGHGNLDPDHYGQYIVQDCAYCYHAQRDYQTIVDRATQAGHSELAAFAKARLASYARFNQSYLKSWHISNPDALDVGQAARQYIDCEHTAASRLSPVYGTVVMIPCERLWPWLASQLKSDAGSSNVYSFWITENDSFHGANRVDNFIDGWFADHQEDYQWETALAVYRSAMTSELNLFRTACGQSLEPMPTIPGLT